MPGKIFINYRRDDAIAAAGRLHDRLAQAFGRKNLFMDVDHIPAGVDFIGYLEAQVASCEVFLAVMGPNWIDARDDAGRRRIENPEDFVTIEIAAALARDIRVIPVLIDGARIPKADELPDALKPLVRRNAVEVRNAQFGRDAEVLVEKVREALKGDMSGPIRWPVAAASGAALLLAGWVGLYQMGVPVWMPWTSGTVQQGTGAADKARTDAEAKREADAAAARKKTADDAKAAAKRADDVAAEKRIADADAAAARKKVEDDAYAARRDPALSVTPGSGQSFRDRLANGQPCPMCPEMVVAPSGSFTMGSPVSEPEREWWQKGTESPQLKVTISRPFAVGKFAVTFDEWDTCVADGGCNGYRPGDQSWGRGKRPVINVNWDDATAYAAWLSRKTGKTYRLLSEAEREYAARAGTTTPFWWGSSITPTQANYDGNYSYAGGGSKGEYRQRTVPVDTFEANPWGLYQVHGNVWEWTEDCWNDSHNGNPGNGSARTTGECSRRVVRGGSWSNYPLDLRAAIRLRSPSVLRFSFLGFRLARTLNP